MARDDTPVLIFDLDGTILRVNSFPFWVLYMIAGPLPELGWRARLTLSAKAQKLLLRRKLGRIDHRQLMGGIQAAWHEATGAGRDEPADRVSRLLRHLVRPALEPLLDRIGAGEADAVLATAAAGEYAIGLGHQLGFRHVLSTPCRLPPDEAINAGQQKLSRVLVFLAAQDWTERPAVLLTDHLDDLPLMRHVGVVVWFGAAAGMARASALAAGTKFVDCRRLAEATASPVLAMLSAYPRSPAGAEFGSPDNTSV